MSHRTRPAAVAALLVLALLLSACRTGTDTASGPATSVDPSASAAVGECPTEALAPGAAEGWGPASPAPSVFPVIISSSGSLTCGHNRFMFSFLDSANSPVGAPDRTASVAFYDLADDPETPVVSAEGTFVWAIEDAVGIYVTTAPFTHAGTWGAEFTTAAPGGPEERMRLQFEVQPESLVVAVGDAAPASDTPTLADVGGDVALLSTDDEPVERFYETSVADALAAKEPFVLVFATPKFCASAQCGPTLDRVKPVAAAHPDVTVINVEPYELQDVDGQLQPVLTNDALTLVPASREWKLLSEPWIFVVDGDGIVQASFEGIVSEDELDAAIADVTGG